MAIIKAYTHAHGLLKSKKFFNETGLYVVLWEAIDYLKAHKIYITDGKKSTEVKFTYKPFVTRPVSYTRPDKIKVRTLSIHPENYPLVAHYADGHSEVIQIN